MADTGTVEAPINRCASCGYDLTGAASKTCPECGYTPTAEELALGERRAVFLELTRWRQWGAYAWQVGPFVLLAVMASSNGPWQIFVLIAILTTFAAAWAEVAGRLFMKVPHGQQRAARAVWRLSTRWLVMPFWAAGAVFFLIVLFAEGQYRDSYVNHLLRVPSVVAVVAYVSAWCVWRWSWRRLARAAGLTDALRGGECAGAAAKKVMWGIGIVLALPVLWYILEILLDTLHPEWWR